MKEEIKTNTVINTLAENKVAIKTNVEKDSTRTSKIARTLGALYIYIYIYISILLHNRESKKAYLKEAERNKVGFICVTSEYIKRKWVDYKKQSTK